MATLRDAEITCHFEADIKLEGVNTFQLDFAIQEGRLCQQFGEAFFICVDVYHYFEVGRQRIRKIGFDISLDIR